MTTPMSLTGDWEIQKQKLKKKYLMLIDSDLRFEPGKKDEMLIRLQIKLGMPKEELIKMIEAL